MARWTGWALVFLAVVAGAACSLFVVSKGRLAGVAMSYEGEYPYREYFYGRLLETSQDRKIRCSPFRDDGTAFYWVVVQRRAEQWGWVVALLFHRTVFRAAATRR
jgi:hypothetical protein